MNSTKVPFELPAGVARRWLSHCLVNWNPGDVQRCWELLQEAGWDKKYPLRVRNNAGDRPRVMDGCRRLWVAPIDMMIPVEMEIEGAPLSGLKTS